MEGADAVRLHQRSCAYITQVVLFGKVFYFYYYKHNILDKHNGARL